MNLPTETAMLEVEQTAVDFIPASGARRARPDKEPSLMDNRPSTFDEVPPFDFVPGLPVKREDRDDLACPICGKQCKNHSGLSSHLRSHRYESS